MSAISTVPVRFEFMCDKERLKYTHNLPRILITTDPMAAQADPQYQSLFVSAIRPIVAQHYAAALAACQDKYCVCGAPKTQANLSPMSFLHIVDDPFVSVIGAPICAKGECEIKARQQVQQLMGELASAAPGAAPGADRVRKTVELKACRVCGKLDDTKKCARCGVVFYCGREHQVTDWPVHKLGCKSVA